MSFLNNISDWFNNTVIKYTYNPVADEFKQLYNQNVSTNLNSLQSTVSNLGSGLGSAILSIPGVGPATQSALIGLQDESKKILDSASSMTPSQIAAANDTLNQKYQALLDKATAEGTAPPNTKLQDAEVTVKTFFTNIFSNVLYICLFVLVIFLAFVGSSLAANNAYNNVKTRAKAYIIYYMIYGFLLFPISLLFGIRNYLSGTLHMFAVLAPLVQGWSSNPLVNLLIFPFVYFPGGADSISQFSRSSLVPQTDRASQASHVNKMPHMQQMPNMNGIQKEMQMPQMQMPQMQMQ